MTENEQKIIEKISDLSGDYKCYDNTISHEESLVLDGLLSEIQQYRAIGTIEEFKALKECVYVDERPFIFTCPNCKEIYTLEQDERPSFCRECNEKIDWDKVIFYQL